MKKFQFSLQVLQDVREREEKTAKNAYHSAQAALNRLEAELDDLTAKKMFCENGLKENMQNRITVDRMQIYYAHLEQLKQQIEKQGVKIKTASKECEILLQKLVEIRKTIKVLETLKQKKYAEYQKEAEKEESKLMDDFINSRALNG